MSKCKDEHQETKATAANENRRRRPATFARTGRRRVVAEPSSHTSALVASASERHTNIRCEKGSDAVATLNRLLHTLEESGIPGPQLFRLQSEFSHSLGQGGQGNVRGVDKEVAQCYRMADKHVRKVWPAEMIAIKQHIERKDEPIRAYFDRQDLASRFRAAECEVLALSSGILHNHPNIVKLVGWGLCLDTLENPYSLCCRGLQLPLLVFERAAMDLEKFLKGLFPEPSPSDASRIEEGLVQALAENPPSSPRPSWPSTMQQYWKPLKWMLGTELDVYEVVRLLCIDVGHGIQCLHENGFSHGDLKPNNILVFKSGRRWISKLCDFGCAVGQVTSAKGAYFGTPYWLPEASEIEALESRHSLQQCDLYVYGLLVWSAFCLRGQHPPINPKLHNALDDLDQIRQSTGHRWLPLASKRKTIFARVSRLLEGTLIDPSRRETQPWTWLYNDYNECRTQKEVPFDAGVAKSNNNSSTEQVSSQFEIYKPHITLEMKGRYDKLSWWQHSDEGLILPAEQERMAGPQNKPGIRTYPDSRPGPASSEALSSDDNPREISLFVNQRSRDVAAYFRLRMMRHFEENIKWSIRDSAYVLPSRPSQSETVQRYQEWYEGLYHMARFRSRIKLKWWNRRTMPDANILAAALVVSPPVDMNTLAWLCAGPVGKTEVKNLEPNLSTWKTILTPSYLDESARLDRFLLLLQFGARVEQRAVRRRGPLQDLNIEAQRDSSTIFSLYIRSCRPAIVPTIIREIANRLCDSRRRGYISESTLYYFFGTCDLSKSGDFPDAEGDCMEDHNFAAVKALRQFMSKRIRLDHYSPLMRLKNHPLLWDSIFLRPELPYGWKRLSNQNGSQSFECFEDIFTRSITLEPPKMSLFEARQVKIGLLQRHPSLACHLDLLSCMRAGVRETQGQTFEADLKSRFPEYDEAWYMSEWNIEPNVRDILGQLKEPCRIQSFTAFLETPGLKGKAVLFLGHVSRVIGITVTIVVMSFLFTAKTFAMWITFH
ncbi:hypothetical protein FPCIR_13874 [Fusarium pseudocircinatum]|uniref:Protein kinase domain-containing protein n=1 Tax=Fusarium pseudocircinatum TaxID=56676 RepID=A0A8H5NRS5_9HYPO|nr:hypothetical protein FPCIR_13874 [Fusarium pseudocircinatum]